MKVKFENLVWQNASGVIVNRTGGKELRHARKLVRQGKAKLKLLSKTFQGYGRSYDSSTVKFVYEITIKE